MPLQLGPAQIVPRYDTGTMGTEKTIADINLLGGHVALDFVNTVDSCGDRWGPDYLTSFRDLAAWALRVDLIDPREHGSSLQKANAIPQRLKSNLKPPQA